MAESAVTSLLEKLGELLANNAKFLYGVKGQVEDAQTELAFMRCFLKDADARAKHDEIVRKSVLEIKDVAYDLEDVIATFSKVVVSRSTPGSKNVLKRTQKLYQVGSKITKISTKFSKLTKALQTYGIKELRAVENTSWSWTNDMQSRELRRAYSHVFERDIIGFDEDIMELVMHLTNERYAHRVVSICGMGGLGKTTIARKVYHHNEVRCHFNSFGWVSISQQCQVRDVWETILVKLISPNNEERERITKLKDDELAKKLHDFQKYERCLVILDDIWNIETWESLKAAFPLDDETNAKILLTTRRRDVALHADRNGFLHEPRCLDENESWELFERKASFWGVDTTSIKDNEKMQELAGKMLKYCAGLPLAINVLTGLLSEKQTVHEWEMFHDNVKTYIRRGKICEEEDSKYTGVTWVLGLSYDELPNYLKPCFLHLAHFPQDLEIRVKELCQLWVAEGFIKQSQQTQSSTINMEDAAYECLSVLVKRSMVQVGEWSSTGRIKTCRLHNLMHDLCLSKVEEENFLQIITSQNRDEALMNSSSSINAAPTNKVRRLAIFYHDDGANHFFPSVNHRESYLKSLRSLICFNIVSFTSFCHVMKPYFNNFYPLRVLKFENLTCDKARKLPKEIGRLIHLKLLSLKHSQVQLPSSISNLTSLQTVDLRIRTITSLKMPTVTWMKFKQLRHLYLPQKYHLRSSKLQLGDLTNLQTLVNISTRYFDMNDFVKLPNLAKLKIQVWTVDANFEEIFKPTSSPFSQLQSLAVMNLCGSIVDLIPLISSCPRIFKLYVDSPIVQLPETSQFSSSLIKLTLRGVVIENDTIAKLEKLPYLRILRLLIDGCQGNEMVCSNGGFPALESFSLIGLKQLNDWRVEKGAFCRLCLLRIEDCHGLLAIPDGLRYVTTLKKIVIQKMPKKFKARVEEGGDDYYKVQHVPALVFLNTEDSIDESSNSADTTAITEVGQVDVVNTAAEVL